MAVLLGQLALLAFGGRVMAAPNILGTAAARGAPVALRL